MKDYVVSNEGDSAGRPVAELSTEELVEIRRDAVLGKIDPVAGIPLDKLVERINIELPIRELKL